MGRYRKIPVEIEAKLFEAGNSDEIAAWCGGRVSVRDGLTKVVIPTLEGAIKASVGDYIIKGVQGEFYPCKPDIFEATYEPLDANDSFEAVANRNYGTIRSSDMDHTPEQL